jgi:hypothetical protein
MDISMDIMYHAVVGVVIAKSFGSEYELSSAFFSILPDVVGTLPYYYYKLTGTKNIGWKNHVTNFYHATTSNTFTNAIDKHIYYATHSLLTAALITVLLYFFMPGAWMVLSLSLLSHIVIDIPTHDGELATRFLYPLSDIHYQANNWTRHLKSFIAFWIVLLFIVYYLS